MRAKLAAMREGRCTVVLRCAALYEQGCVKRLSWGSRARNIQASERISGKPPIAEHTIILHLT